MSERTDLHFERGDFAAVFHALLEGVRQGAAVVSVDRTVLTCNQPLGSMLKQKCEQTTGRSITDFLSLEDRPRLEELFQSFPRDFRRLQVKLTGSNPLPLPAELAVEAFTVDGLRVFLLLATDLSRRRRAEEQIAFQAGLLENVNDAIFALDARENITYWNSAAERLYGWTADEVMGRPLLDVVHSTLTHQEQADRRRRLVGGEQVLEETLHYHREGKPIDVEGRGVALRSAAGEINGYVWVNRDVSDRRRAQDLLRKNSEEDQKHAQEMAKYAEQMQEYAAERQNRAAVLEQRVAERTAALEQANRSLAEENARRQQEIVERERAEEKLRQVVHSLEETMLAFRESEDLLRIAIEAAGMVAWTYNPEKDEIVTTVRTPEWLKIVPEESFPLLSRGMDLLHPDDRAIVAEALPRVLGGEPFNLELRLVLPDGSIRWLATQGRMMGESPSKPRLLVGVTRDITATRASEINLLQLNRTLQERTHELEAERARWQRVVEGIADEVWVCDTGGRMSLINLPQVTHMGLQEFQDKTISEVYEEVDILNLDGQMRAYNDAPLIRALQGEVVRGEEIMRHRRTGHTRYRQYGAAPTRDSTGAITGSVAIVRDVTEQKQAEQRLLNRETTLAQAGQMAHLGAWDIEFLDQQDVNANPLTWSDEVYRIFGYTPGEIEVTNALFFERVHPDDRVRVQDAVAQAIATHRPYSIEHRIVRTDGTERVVREYGQVFFDVHDHPARIVGAVQDVTDREYATRMISRLNGDLERRATELEIANRELESFSYSVSHDLRTPLATMTGFSQLLSKEYGTQLPAAAQRYLELIQANGQQMSELITSLLALSRHTRQPIQKQLVDMTGLARDALQSLQNETARPGLTIELRDMPGATADPVLIRQVWVNLTANAVKFTRGRKDARVEMGCQPCDGEDRAYFVRDNGVGFDMAQVDRLFGVFQRLHHDEEYEGTGVGLALVQRIIHRHGGRVWAEGEVGKGATFYFTLGNAL